MDADRRDSRSPGRRQDDELTRALVRTLLHDEGFLNRDQMDLRYQRLRNAADLRGWAIIVLTLVNVTAAFWHH